MRRALLCAVLGVAFAPSGAGAQSLMLTESDALARLSADSPRARALRAAVDVARVDVLSAARWPNPQPSVTRESVSGVTEYLTAVSQVLPITGRRALDIQAASALVSATSSRAEDELGRLRADLRLAFAELVAAQTSEHGLTGTLQRLRELVEVLAERETEGDAAGFDRLRAEREMLDVESDLVVAATERARAQATLAAFFAEAVDPSQIGAVSGTGPATAVPALEVLLEQAEATRGELIALRHEAQAAGFAARAAGRRRLPEPEILAGTKSSSFAGGDVGSLFTVRAVIPVFDRGRPERALAAAREAQAEALAASFRVVLRGQVTALREAVIRRRAAAERYRAEAVGSAAQIERIAQIAYDEGERGILELLDALRIGASARIRQTTLDFAVRQAEIELSFASGWEMP
jgi:cobalt-zinc-cadmium efflux system outer membrane protein